MAAKRKKATKKTRGNLYTTIPLPDGGEIKLTKKRAEFARFYALTHDAKNSRLKAGFANTPSNNKQEGWKLLQYPEVQDAVEYYEAQLAKKLDISENRILAEIAAIAFSNLADCEDEHGNTIDLAKLESHTQRAIKSKTSKRYLEGMGDEAVEVEIQKIEMHPKLAALKLLTEIKGMKAEKDKNAQRPVNVNVNVSGKSATTKVEQ
jgi:phage terminase small subunit